MAQAAATDAEGDGGALLAALDPPADANGGVLLADPPAQPVGPVVWVILFLLLYILYV